MDIIPKTQGFAVLIKPDSKKLHDVPSPSICWALGGQGGFILGYLIEGSADTYKAQQFLSDVAARFCATYGAEIADTPVCEPILNNGLRYELKTLAEGLESLKRRASTFPTSKRVYGKGKGGGDDQLFWLAKEFCEQRLKIANERFSEFDIKQVILAAGGTYSEAKAKAKSIYRWYKERGFKPSKRVHTMTRSEAAKNATQQKVSKNRSAIESAITSMKLFQEKITAVKVSEITGISRQTCSKYIKEMKLEGLL